MRVLEESNPPQAIPRNPQFVPVPDKFTSIAQCYVHAHAQDHGHVINQGGGVQLPMLLAQVECVQKKHVCILQQWCNILHFAAFLLSEPIQQENRTSTKSVPSQPYPSHLLTTQSCGPKRMVHDQLLPNYIPEGNYGHRDGYGQKERDVVKKVGDNWTRCWREAKVVDKVKTQSTAKILCLHNTNE